MSIGIQIQIFLSFEIVNLNIRVHNNEIYEPYLDRTIFKNYLTISNDKKNHIYIWILMDKEY